MKTRIHGDPDGSQRKFFSLCPPRLTVEVVREWPDKYEYVWVEGTHPRALNANVWIAIHQMWRGRDKRTLDIDRNTYCEYVRSVAEGPPDALLERALYLISTESLTAVSACHGDLTFENIVIREDQSVCFIDPGNPRGCPCVENDKGKLLQSQLGWERLKRSDDEGFTIPLYTIHRPPIVWAFLYTHIIRLLRHHGDDTRVRNWVEDIKFTVARGLRV